MIVYFVFVPELQLKIDCDVVFVSCCSDTVLSDRVGLYIYRGTGRGLNLLILLWGAINMIRLCVCVASPGVVLLLAAPYIKTDQQYVLTISKYIETRIHNFVL